LVDAELDAVDDGRTENEQLLAKLVDVPTRGGLTAGRLVQLEEMRGQKRPTA
jgi:hypothetical protein